MDIHTENSPSVTQRGDHLQRYDLVKISEERKKKLLASSKSPHEENYNSQLIPAEKGL